MRAPKVCAHPGCPAFQPCPKHTTAKWAKSTRRTELPRNWHRIRKRILQRDPLCTICTKDFSTEVHHMGDKHNHTDANLAGTCHACHAKQTARQAAEARSST